MVSEHTVRHHDDHRHQKHVRQPPTQFERNHMPDMQNVAAGASSCVDKEWLLLLEPFQHKLSISVRAAVCTYPE